MVIVVSDGDLPWQMLFEGFWGEPNYVWTFYVRKWFVIDEQKAWVELQCKTEIQARENCGREYQSNNNNNKWFHFIVM